MMEVMMAKKKTMSQLCEGLTIYPQVLKNVRVADKAVAQADEDVQAAVAEIAAKLGDSGRILVRESGTEPLVRVMVEAQTQEICQECVDYVVDAIRRKGHAV
jgi:phosphoglucosamine mutase